MAVNKPFASLSTCMRSACRSDFYAAFSIEQQVLMNG